MKKTKKLLLTLVSSALIATSVAPMASCGGGNAGNNSKVVAYDGSAVTVTFYHTMGEKLRGVLNQYIPEFNAMYPNITIEHQSYNDYPGLRNQISTMLTAGNSPSLAYCYPDHVALYNVGKAVVTLDDYIASTEVVTKNDGTTEQMGFTQKQIDEDFVEGYYEEGRAYGDGKMYTLPYSKSTEVLYYNKTYFEANNISVPTTWEEMKAVCKTIKDKEGSSVTPLGYDSEANWFITMCEQYGLPYTSATQGEHFKFNTAEHRAFVEEFRDWYAKGYVTTEEIYGTYTSALFTAQNSFMTIGSSAGASYQCPDEQTREDGTTYYPFEVGIAMIPQVNPNKPKVISQGPSLCMFKKSEQEQAATWLFMKFLMTHIPLQADFSKASGYAPVVDVSSDTVYTDFLNKADGNARLQASCVKQCIKQENALYVSPAFDGSSAARDEVGALMQKCLVDGVNSAAIAGFFNDTIELLAADYGY